MRAMEDARKSVEATKPNTFMDRMMESFMERSGMGSRALPEQPTFFGIETKDVAFLGSSCLCVSSVAF